MKVLISADMEGTAGVVIWGQVMPPDLISWGNPAPAEYETARTAMVKEVNAAIRGAKAAGATEIIVNESHDGMRNLRPEELDPDAWLISGSRKPLGMCCGIDHDVDAVILTGYHARAGSPDGPLAHSFTTGIMDIWIGDTVVGEAGMNAATVGHFNAPVVAITGDHVAVAQMQELVPDCAGAIVKYGLGRNAARHMHPSKARDLIEAAAKDGVSRAKTIKPWKPGFPTTIKARFDTAERVDVAMLVPGVTRADSPTGDICQFEAENGEHMMQMWQAVMTTAGTAQR